MKNILFAAIVAVALPLAVSPRGAAAEESAFDLNPLAKYQLHPAVRPAEKAAKQDLDSTKASEIQANADLEPSYPFTLMLITRNGPDGVAASPFEALAKNWVRSPTTARMQFWRTLASVREYAANDPFLTEHHQHILNNHQTLPVIALVDSRGGDWCSLSGSSLPGSEYELARTLDIRYAAIMKAASEQDGMNVRMMSANQLATARGGAGYWRGGPNNRPNGPTPFNQPNYGPNGPNRNPFNRPRIFDGGGLVNIPDHYDVNAQTGLDRSTRILVFVAIGGLVIFGLLIFAGMLIAAAIKAFAQTDPDDDDMVINQPIDE